MDDNQSIAEHYTHGSLERAIFEALSAAGKDLDRLEPADLASVDEFHIGGRQASGFTVEEPRSRTAFALEFFNQMRAQGAQPPPLGLHILMGPRRPRRLRT